MSIWTFFFQTVPQRLAQTNSESPNSLDCQAQGVIFLWTELLKEVQVHTGHHCPSPVNFFILFCSMFSVLPGEVVGSVRHSSGVRIRCNSMFQRLTPENIHTVVRFTLTLPGRVDELRVVSFVAFLTEGHRK